MSDPADFFSWDAFSPSGPPASSKPKRHEKAIPDQRELFGIQRDLKRLGQEINSHVDGDLYRIERAYAKVWKRMVAYLEEWKQ